MYPENKKDIFGDLGICVREFELWKCIRLFDYQFLGIGAMEEAMYKVISLECLLPLKALAMDQAK